MSSSLRDQLLKAGLVNEKQAKQAVKEKRKDDNRQKGQNRPSQNDQERERQKQLQAEKAERDRQLNLKRQAEAEERALLAQVRQLIEANKLEKGESDKPFNFADGGKVKRIYIADDMRTRIAKGLIAVVRSERTYELVPAEVADRIRERRADVVVLQNQNQATVNKAEDADPYAGYEVPDDLIW